MSTRNNVRRLVDGFETGGNTMIERYADKTITEMWTDREKVRRWQKTELAVIKAREKAGIIPKGTYWTITDSLLQAGPCDITWWKEREDVLRHDLNAWLEERMRFIPSEFQQYFHQGLTSYDTEEPAFALMLDASTGHIITLAEKLLSALHEKALKFRCTPMNGRTHGQEAELQSFGKRCLTWFQDLQWTEATLNQIRTSDLKVSKLSGAMGSYSGLSPELEQAALAEMKLEPFYGATQIMPRILYAPLASALADIATVLDKIATDIRLGARSGRPLWHEPFGKKQKGSSAMPHKKNTISTEKVEGMARMARSYAAGIKENIKTWEERAIEQSSIERGFWPDLFHVVAHALVTMTKVITGLVVYPDNMMREIIDSRGTYASNEAKEFLVKHGSPVGIGREDAYRIVQLASFNAFWRGRHEPPANFKESDTLFQKFNDDARQTYNPRRGDSIEIIISNAALQYSDELDAMPDVIDEWKKKLMNLFIPNERLKKDWHALFLPSHALKREAFLFTEVFGA